MSLSAEELDLPDALEVVHEQGVHGAAGLAAGPVARSGGFGVPNATGYQKRHGNQRHGCEERIIEEEQGGHSQDSQHRDDSLFRSVDEQPLHGSHVLDDSGH